MSSFVGTKVEHFVEYTVREAAVVAITRDLIHLNFPLRMAAQAACALLENDPSPDTVFRGGPEAIALLTPSLGSGFALHREVLRAPEVKCAEIVLQVGAIWSRTLERAARTVDIIWAAGAIVQRWSPDLGSYLEELSIDPKHIRMDRLRNGMSLLDTHAAGTMDSRLGTVVPGSVRVEGGKGYATVKLSHKQRAEELMQDLQDGHPFPVSVGYRTHVYEKREGDGKSLPVLRAIDWEPFELSAVPVPADGDAHSRAADAEGTECRVVSLVSGVRAMRMRMRQATALA